MYKIISKLAASCHVGENPRFVKFDRSEVQCTSCTLSLQNSPDTLETKPCQIS